MKVIGLAGWSGAGKTTLLSRVLPHLIASGVRVSTIKHAHHAFDVDTPGKDSWRHRQAGAHEVLVTSTKRFALMHELRGQAEPDLSDLLRRLDPVDIVVIEGFKRAQHRKIEVHRVANGKPPLFPGDPTIAAIVTDAEFQIRIPRAHLDDISAIAALILATAVPL